MINVIQCSEPWFLKQYKGFVPIRQRMKFTQRFQKSAPLSVEQLYTEICSNCVSKA